MARASAFRSPWHPEPDEAPCGSSLGPRKQAVRPARHSAVRQARQSALLRESQRTAALLAAELFGAEYRAELVE